MNDIKTVYGKIAKHFDNTRGTYNMWDNVKHFQDSLKTESCVVVIGCGNGKNMSYREDLIYKGIDISPEFVKICRDKHLNVIEGSMLELPFANNTFDAIMAIASYHHLDNENDRKKALDEMYRVLMPNGKAHITVWAVEQPYSSKFKFTRGDNIIPWTIAETKEVVNRYYNIYSRNDLVNEIRRLKPEFTILKQINDNGNWCVTIQKYK